MCHRFILVLIDLKLLQSIFFVDCKKKKLECFTDWSDLFHMYMWERANWSSHTFIFWKRFRSELFNMDPCRIQPQNLSNRAELQGEAGVPSSESAPLRHHTLINYWAVSAHWSAHCLGFIVHWKLPVQPLTAASWSWWVELSEQPVKHLIFHTGFGGKPNNKRKQPRITFDRWGETLFQMT